MALRQIVSVSGPDFPIIDIVEDMTPI